MSKQKQINFKIDFEDIARIDAIVEYRQKNGLSTSLSDFAKQCFFAAIEATPEKPILMRLPNEAEIQYFLINSNENNMAYQSSIIDADVSIDTDNVSTMK